MAAIVGAVVLGIIAAACFVTSGLQFGQKGFLFNNAYIYASEKERESMNKKPYYRQSGVVFLLLGTVFSVNAIQAITKDSRLFFVTLAILLITAVYAVWSSVAIAKKK